MSIKIAIVGSGQLAQMMAQAGVPMGMQFSFLAEGSEDTCCVDSLGRVVFREEYANVKALYQALGEPNVVTVEKEHVDIDLLAQLQAFCPVHPNPDALRTFKNRRIEKQFLQSLNIPIAPYKSVRTEAHLDEAMKELAQPIFLKSEEQGYDGYNQYKVTNKTLGAVKRSIAFPSDWVAESFVDFEREVSFLAARSADGKFTFYPAVENYHRDGVLLTSIAPAAGLSQRQQEIGQSYLSKIVEAVDYVGLICMECFIHDDAILVNEIAPRVHNSGHWTIKGALTSQFENHIRAVAGLKLGSTEVFGINGMLNLLGVELSADAVCDDKSFLTLYGKEPRPRRKLGHVTIHQYDHVMLKQQLDALRCIAYNE